MKVKRNLAANYLAQGWTALMGLAFIPWYIKLLGIEAYGLVGVFTVLQSLLVLLDMSLSFVLNREMARFGAGAHSASAIRNLIRSMECLSLAVALLCAVCIASASGWIAQNWLHVQSLPASTVRQAIAAMGVVVGCKVIEGIYQGAILGLQRQVWLATAGAILSTLRWAGVIPILLFVDRSVEAFFMWQAVVSAISATSYCVALYRQLPEAPEPARFSVPALVSLWQFSAGLLMTSVLGLVLTQLDKVLLSRVLTLEEFGYYTLATVTSNSLLILATPANQAFYPRLTELVTRDDEQALASIYHLGSQLVSTLIAPAALLMIFFAEPLLLLWTGNAFLASKTAPLLALLAAGTLFNGLMNMPYMLQLAHGWSQFAAWINAVAVALLTPALLWIVPRYGAAGAACIWIALNAGYLTVGAYLMHRRLLPNERRKWYVNDIASPVLAAGLVLAVAFVLMPKGLTAVPQFIWLCVWGITAVAAAIGAAARIRVQARQLLRIIFTRKEMS